MVMPTALQVVISISELDFFIFWAAAPRGSMTNMIAKKNVFFFQTECSAVELIMYNMYMFVRCNIVRITIFFEIGFCMSLYRKISRQPLVFLE